MSKALFRFLRGELNGFYITSINETLNRTTKDIRKFLSDFYSMQFNNKMPSDYIYGLGKFAGIYLLRFAKSESVASFRLSESDIEDGTEYSERGLYNTNTESFEYETDETEDINNKATPTLRSSMIGDEQAQGYIATERDDAILPDGRVNTDTYLLPNAPSGVAYNNYYGDKFLFLSEATKTVEPLVESLFIELYKAMQWIRYNGVSIASLCKIVSIICPKELLLIESIEPTNEGKTIVVNYRFNDNSTADLKQQRLSLLLFVISTKFTRVNFVEII